MIPNNNKIVNISSSTDTNGNIIIQGNNSYYKAPYYITKFLDDSDFNKFVKGVEREVRSSDEYSRYLWTLKNQGLESCAFLGNINDDNATIEFHHYPFTLYDIVSIVTEKRLAKKELVSSFLVAKEVLNLHFNNKAGLIPLSKTVHELTHAGEIFINLNQVFGYYQEFIDEYNDYINDEIRHNYNEIIKMSKANKDYSEKDILAH